MTSLFPVLLFMYILVIIATVFMAKVFLIALDEGKLLRWYDRKVLQPLIEKNSKWAEVLGGCELCFTSWLGSLTGSIFITGCLLYFGYYWWILALPSYFFLSTGLSAFMLMITSKKK